jgi:hypothetical protein
MGKSPSRFWPSWVKQTGGRTRQNKRAGGAGHGPEPMAGPGVGDEQSGHLTLHPRRHRHRTGLRKGLPPMATQRPVRERPSAPPDCGRACARTDAGIPEAVLAETEPAGFEHPADALSDSRCGLLERTTSLFRRC